MKKLFFQISFVLIFIIGLIGCSSKIESSELMNKYYENIKSNNFDENYGYLSSASKNIWTKENFKEWESINEEVFTFKDVKIEKTNEYKDKDLDGIKYQDVVEYNITEIDYDNYGGKDISGNYVRYVVNENNQWKIYRGKDDPKKKMSNIKLFLASMYLHGKGKEEDLNKAENILNESIKENPNYSENYHVLGYTYIKLQRYDEAINCEQQYIDMSENNEDKSEGYDVLALAYEDKKDYVKAKECYTQAIEVNPNDENAKIALRNLN